MGQSFVVTCCQVIGVVQVDQVVVVTCCHVSVVVHVVVEAQVSVALALWRCLLQVQEAAVSETLHLENWVAAVQHSVFSSEDISQATMEIMTEIYFRHMKLLLSLTLVTSAGLLVLLQLQQQAYTNQ